MKSLIRFFFKSYNTNPALFGTVLVTISTVIGSVFSYFLQLAIARLLSVADFGTFNAYLSLAYIVNVPASVLGLSLIKMIAEFKAENAFHKVSQTFEYISVACLGLGAVLVLFFTLGRSLLSSYLKITDTGIAFYFGLFLAFTLVVMIPASYLQGLLRFKAYSFYVVLNSFLRFLFPVCAMAIGMRVSGIYGAMAVSFAVSYVIGTMLLVKNFKKEPKINLNSHYRKLLLFSGSVVFVNLGMVLLNNIDVIMVKRFFSGEMAGIYSGVVTVGKFMLFGAGAVSIVMFPQISELYTMGVNYSEKIIKLLILQVLLVIGVGSAFALFPHVLVTILFGSKFDQAIPYIPSFTIFMSLYVLINFLTMFFLAIEKTKLFFLQLPLIVLQFILLNVFHKTLYDVILIDIAIGILLLGCFLTYLYKVLKSVNNQIR